MTITTWIQCDIKCRIYMVCVTIFTPGHESHSRGITYPPSTPQLPTMKTNSDVPWTTDWGNIVLHEIMWNANLMQQGNFIDVFLTRHVSGTYAHHQEHYILSCSIWFSAPFLDGWWWSSAQTIYDRTAPSAPYTRPTQKLSRPPSIQNLGAENHMLQLNI